MSRRTSQITAKRDDRLRRVSLIPVRPDEGRLSQHIADSQSRQRELVFMLRVFGCLPDTGVSERPEAGVRKASGEETAGEWSPAVVSAYGDWAPVIDLIGGFEQGRRLRGVCDWSPRAGSGRRCRGERSAFWRSEWALTVAIGGAWPLPGGYRPGPGAMMRGGGKSVVVMSCRARAMGWTRAEARSQVRRSGR